VFQATTPFKIPEIVSNIFSVQLSKKSQASHPTRERDRGVGGVYDDVRSQEGPYSSSFALWSACLVSSIFISAEV
jgi:hypothetical protein